MAKKKTYDDDDGRTIADMSGLERPGMLRAHRSEEGERPPAPPKGPVGRDDGLGPFESKEARRMYIWGALRAALLIALVFIAGLGLVTLLLMFFWK